MGFYLRPGVFVKELDLSQIIAATATTIGAIVGSSPKGDVDNPVLVTTKQEFIDECGKPILGNHFHDSALAFLEEGNQLWYHRVHNGAKYGGAHIAPEQSAQVTSSTVVSGAFKAGKTSPADDVLEAITQVDSSPDGVDLTFTIQLADAPILPGSVTLGWTKTTAQSVGDTDNGDGTGYFDDGTAFATPATDATIDYQTGVISLTFDTGQAPDNSTNITVTYDAAALFMVYAKDPGVWNNSIIVDIDNVERDNNTFEIKVTEVLADGTTELREVFVVSRDSAKLVGGVNAYLENVINSGDSRSKYIRVLDNTAYANTILPESSYKRQTIGTGDGSTAAFEASGAAYSGSDTALAPGSSGNIVPNTTVFRATDVNGNAMVLYGTGTVATPVETVLGDAPDTPTASQEIQYEGANVGQYSVEFEANVINAGEVVADFQDDLSYAITMASGSDGSAVTDAEIILGWDKFTNPNEIDISLLINAGYATPAVQNKMITLCESRKDCFAILDTPDGLTPTEAVHYRRYTLNANTSYAALYYPWLDVYDTENRIQRSAPPSGFVAAAYVRTDRERDPWIAPAGLRRGSLRVIEARQRLTEGNMEHLYSYGVNYILTAPGLGTSIDGQKTLQSYDSSLNRVNVRRLLIVMEKSISRYLVSFKYEPNVQRIRNQLVAGVDDYLAQIQSRDGIEGRKVVSNSKNNPPAIRNANQMNVDIYFIPVKAAEFIQLGVVILPSGAEFEETIAAVGTV